MDNLINYFKESKSLLYYWFSPLYNLFRLLQTNSKKDLINNTNYHCFHLGISGTFRTCNNIWLKACSFWGPLTSYSCKGITVIWKSSYISTIWSRYFFCIFERALHILQESSGNNTWFTTMFLISISKVVSS